MVPFKLTFLAAAFTSCLIAHAANAALALGQMRTVTGMVDGQKFGTNVIGEGAIVTFEADSENETRLLKACDIGTRCKVVVTTNRAAIVMRFVNAERVTQK